jgi:hypothetical protein
MVWCQIRFTFPTVKFFFCGLDGFWYSEGHTTNFSTA